MTDCSDLLRAYVSQGDESAFRALVDCFLPLVYSTALRQVGGNTTLAEEVSQDVFIALARKSRFLVDRPTLTPWLFNATRLSAINKLRHEQRRLEREQKAYVMQQIDPGSEEIDWDRIRPVIDGLLSQLSPRDQETVCMRFFEGRTFTEIGEKLRIGEDGARLRSNRAIDKINRLLARRGIRSTSAVLTGVLATQQSIAVPTGLAAATTAAVLSGSTTAAGGFALSHLLPPLMNTSQIFVGSLAVLAIAGLGGALYQSHANRNAVASLAALREEHVALQREITELRGKAVNAAMKSVPRANETAAQPASAGVPDGSKLPTRRGPLDANISVPSSVEALLRQVDHVLAHPELRPAFVGQVVQQLWGNDQRLFKSLGVSPAQEEAIKKEAGDYANTLLDARARRVGGEDFSEAFAAADEYSFNQVKRILGEENFAQLKQLKASGRENNTVDQLAARLYFTESPLTGEQANQLTRILVQNRFSVNQTDTVAGQKVSDSDYSTFRGAQSPQHRETKVALITDAAVQQAHATLPPRTVAALKNLQAQQIIQIRLLTSMAGQ
jgi:RNA polymerase sigma factor (sigma-70 family)